MLQTQNFGSVDIYSKIDRPVIYRWPDFTITAICVLDQDGERKDAMFVSSSMGQTIVPKKVMDEIEITCAFYDLMPCALFRITDKSAGIDYSVTHQLWNDAIQKMREAAGLVPG